VHLPRTKIGLIAGFGISLSLMVVLALIGLLNMASIHERLDTVIRQNIVKTELARQMREISRERTVCLYRMIASPDPFIRDEEFMRFNSLAGEFVAARTRFLELGVDELEAGVLQEQGDLSGESIVLQNRVIELVEAGQFDEASELLYTKTVPAQDSVFQKLGELLSIQKRKVQQADAAAESSYQQTVLVTLVLGLFAVTLGVLVAAFVIRRTTGIEQTLMAHKQQLEHRVEQRTRDLSEYASELEQLTYSIAHDLRGPLRGIDGFSLFMLEEFADRLDATGKDYLYRIRAANLRMSDIIDALLRIIKVIQVKVSRRPVDLSALASAISAKLRAREPDRNIEFRIQQGMLENCDQKLITIALQELLDNAWKFTQQQDPAIVELRSTRNEQGETVYCMADNGIGFDMEYVGKLFQAFQTLHSPGEFEGIGIGLAIAARIVHRHGGRIWAESSADNGTSICFTLSLAR